MFVANPTTFVETGCKINVDPDPPVRSAILG